jgi:predicted  nucleic acid-binding Zn-ribbon protein
VFCGADKYEYRQRTLELHDAFAEVNKSWGLNRGDSITVTHRKHRSTEEYRRELSNQCSTLEREVDEKYATLSKLNGQIRLAETRIKGLQTMISNLESSRDAVEKEIDSIHQKLSSGEVDLEQQHLPARKEESLQKKLDSILFTLEDKRSKLSEADRKLDELHEQLEKAQARHEDLETQIKDANVNVSHIVMNKIGAEALWSVLRDFTTAKPHMTPEELERFEGSFINEMSRKGVHIIACASLLAMGMIDQATNYAENCGGGGTSCDNNWGKDPEEDERNWLRRCLAKSRAMMKPSARRMKR